MKEYIVLELKCRKNITLSEIYLKIKETFSFNQNFFAIQNLKSDRISKENKRRYDELNLQQFEYIKVLEHLKNSPYYDPDRDDRRMLSNADDRWEWNNPQFSTSLCENDFIKLIQFCDNLKALDVSSLVIGIDEIEWGGEKVSKGTYGYKKANCTYALGNNYLSNSVMIGRTHENKDYTVYLSCEIQFRKLDIVEKFIYFLGDLINETTHFAPENDEERAEWEIISKNANEKFQNAICELENLDLKPIENKDCTQEKKINIKKYITKYLCNDGWNIQKALADEWPTTICKDKEDTSIHLSVISAHNGHHLQSIVYYRSKQFVYSEHIYRLSYNAVSEQDIEQYFLNAQMIRDYLYKLL